MTGCDYQANFEGVGFKTLMKATMNPQKFGRKGFRGMLVKKSKDEPKVDKFLADVSKTTIGFRYPLVINQSYQLVYTNADKLKADGVDKADLAYYAGTKYNDIQAFTQGKLDIKTGQVREPVDVNFKRLTDFLEFIPDTSSGRLNNLCARLVTSENFDRINSSARTTDEDDEREPRPELPPAKRVKRESLV